MTAKTTNQFFDRSNPHFLGNVIVTIIIIMMIVTLCVVGVPAAVAFRNADVASTPIIGPEGPQGPAGESVAGPKGEVGPKGDTGPAMDPATLLANPAFKAAVDQAVAAQVAQALVSAPAAPSTSSAEPAKVVVDATGGAVVTKLQNTQDMGQWKVQYFTGATALMKGFQFTDFVPGWKEFPNVDWPAGKFLAKNGLEYGQELSDFCQQDQTCDFPVAARSYRTITADYNVSGIGECHEAGTGIGCALIIVNMGDVTASFRKQMVDTGHTITGLYWNGDEIDQAVSAWASHVVYRMVGVPGGNPANPGANCSVPTGCKGVNITFAVTSGNELLVLGNAVVK